MSTPGTLFWWSVHISAQLLPHFGTFLSSYFMKSLLCWKPVFTLSTFWSHLISCSTVNFFARTQAWVSLTVYNWLVARFIGVEWDFILISTSIIQGSTTGPAFYIVTGLSPLTPGNVMVVDWDCFQVSKMPTCCSDSCAGGSEHSKSWGNQCVCYNHQDILGGAARQSPSYILCAVIVYNAHSATPWPAERRSTYNFPPKQLFSPSLHIVACMVAIRLGCISPSSKTYLMGLTTLGFVSQGC